MKSMNMFLPESMRSYVEEQVAKGGYGTVSEYIRELIRQDQKRYAQENLEALLLEGLNSGAATGLAAQDWADIHVSVRQKLAQRREKSKK